MHTFKKEADGTYAVGQWLVGALEFKFMPIFYVSDRQNAIAAINALNGADLTAAPLYPDFKVIAEHEPKKRRHKGTFIATAIIIGAIIGMTFSCTRAKATDRPWKEPPQVTLPKQVHGDWCRGEGSYVRDIANCPPPDRVIIRARSVTFHKDDCIVRSAVPHANTSRRMPLQYHASLWCRPAGYPPAYNPTIPHPLGSTPFYWLGLWRGGNNLMITETNQTFDPLDYRRFLREHPDD
jgi:hypothetical protein